MRRRRQPGSYACSNYQILCYRNHHQRLYVAKGQRSGKSQAGYYQNTRYTGLRYACSYCYRRYHLINGRQLNSTYYNPPALQPLQLQRIPVTDSITGSNIDWRVDCSVRPVFTGPRDTTVCAGSPVTAACNGDALYLEPVTSILTGNTKSCSNNSPVYHNFTTVPSLCTTPSTDHGNPNHIAAIPVPPVRLQPK